MQLDATKLYCKALKSNIKKLNEATCPKFTSEEDFIKKTDSLIKRSTKSKKKVFKSRITCAPEGKNSDGISFEDIKYLIEILSLANPVFEQIHGYFEEVEQNFAFQKLESIRFYAGYGIELTVQCENLGKSNNAWQTQAKAHYETLKTYKEVPRGDMTNFLKHNINYYHLYKYLTK